MANTYIIVLSTKTSIEKVKPFFDQHADIKDWFYCFHNSMFITTDLTAHQIFTMMENKFGENRVFISQVVSGKYYGRIPTDQWSRFK